MVKFYSQLVKLLHASSRISVHAVREKNVPEESSCAVIDTFFHRKNTVERLFEPTKLLRGSLHLLRLILLVEGLGQQQSDNNSSCCWQSPLASHSRDGTFDGTEEGEAQV